MFVSNITPFADLLHNTTDMMLPDFATAVAVDSVRPAAWDGLDITLYLGSVLCPIFFEAFTVIQTVG